MRLLVRCQCMFWSYDLDVSNLLPALNPEPCDDVPNPAASSLDYCNDIAKQKLPWQLGIFPRQLQ
jgi:hypothetical protein